MTDREKAIVMAYTGICMLAGDKFQIFHKYIEDIMGRPIWTHEIGFLADEIKEKSEADFMVLCRDESSSGKPKMGHWIARVHNGMHYIECSNCSSSFLIMYLTRDSYCPNCGAKMQEVKE